MTGLWTVASAALHATAILVLAWFIGGWLRGLLARVLEGRADPTLRAFLAGATRPIVVVLAVAPAMEVLGLSISTFIALLSTVGLAIAFAMKGSLSNVASGALLLTTRPFHVGDDAVISGISGRVRRIGILTTEVETEDGRRVSIANDKVLAMPMERLAAEGKRRVDVEVRLPAREVSDELLDRLRAAAGAVGGGAAGGAAGGGAPREAVVPLGFDGEHVRISVRIWVDASHAHEARSSLFMALNATLRAADR